jgi:hypothetical protein
MKSRPWILPLVIGVLILSTLAAAGALIGTLGRISVLEEEADSAAVVTAGALAAEVEAQAAEAEARLGEASARESLATSFEEASQERAEATLRDAEARATLIIQEAEGEAAFRRLTGYLESKDDLLGVRLAEEMDAEFRVQGILSDQALDVSASSLFIAQTRIGTFEIQVDSLNSAHAVTLASHNTTLATHALTIAAFQAEGRIREQIIEEYRNNQFPSFLRKIWDMPEVALFGAAVGVIGCWALCPDSPE